MGLGHWRPASTLPRRGERCLLGERLSPSSVGIQGHEQALYLRLGIRQQSQDPRSDFTAEHPASTEEDHRWGRWLTVAEDEFPMVPIERDENPLFSTGASQNV